jgi:hypothetical protein
MADHRVIDISNSSISCGITNVSRLSDEQEKNAFALGTAFYHPAHGHPPAFVQWSNLADEETNGHRFAAFMCQFGLVVPSKAALNPHTGNMICIWTLLVDHEAFKTWWKNQKIEKIKKESEKYGQEIEKDLQAGEKFGKQ